MRASSAACRSWSDRNSAPPSASHTATSGPVRATVTSGTPRGPSARVIARNSISNLPKVLPELPGTQPRTPPSPSTGSWPTSPPTGVWQMSDRLAVASRAVLASPGGPNFRTTPSHTAASIGVRSSSPRLIPRVCQPGGSACWRTSGRVSHPVRMASWAAAPPSGDHPSFSPHAKCSWVGQTRPCSSTNPGPRADIRSGVILHRASKRARESGDTTSSSSAPELKYSGAGG